jgi:hypothetical protein
MYGSSTRGTEMTAQLTFNEYLEAFILELEKRGIKHPHNRGRVASLYRNAGYSPKEAAELEEGE